MEQRDGPGTLYVVATPIGNSRDMSERGREILETVDLIAAEDTRRSVVLLNKLGIRNDLSAYLFKATKRKPMIIPVLTEL